MNTHVQIKIGATGDPTLFPDVNVDSHGEIIGVGILEGATATGCAGAFLLIKNLDEHGHVILVSMTAKMLRAIGAAANGAIQRFKDPD